MAAGALARLPVVTVLPDLGTTDGDRTFRLARAGVYTVRLAAPPHLQPTLAIDGAAVPLERARTEAGFDILTGAVELDAGPHRLALRLPPPPAPVVSMTHQPPEAEAFQPCESVACGGPVRVEATVPRDGRTVAFLGRVTAGADDAYAIGAQVHPSITHVRHREEAGRRDRLVRVEVPLDPGSGTAILDVTHLHEQLPGLEFELLEVAISPLPHGLSVVLADERQPTASGNGALVLTGDERGWAAAEYAGEAAERLVRLDERFDPRWVLHVNDAEVSPERHVVLDGHFNGWFVNLAPGDAVTVTFIPNHGYFWISIANLVFLFGMIVVGWAPVPRQWWRWRR